MGEIGWRFPPLSGGTRQGYTNNDIEGFKGEELIDNLAREICQNSLDAEKKDSTLPVKVIFELKSISSNEYDVFGGYKKCIAGCREYWGANMDANLTRFLADAEKMLSRAEIPVLVAGDYNTCGLKGSRSRELSSSWEALTGADGMSVKNAETSGGSYGIGKNAPFACSALSMVFYNTYAQDKEKAFIGVARLATLFDKDKKETQRVGRYQKNDNLAEQWTPIFEEDSDTFRDIFKRNEMGTDVIIVGFNQENDWVDNIAKAVLKNFFVAINENKLIVEIRDGLRRKSIDSSTISQMISDYADDKNMMITSQLYQAFTAADKMVPLSILEENDVAVYIKSESDFSRTIANFRDTGMLVGLKSRRIFQHYAAVLVVRGKQLGGLLRATEPPRHNRWDYKLITGESEKDKRKKAHQAIKKIEDTVLELLKNQFEIAPADTTDAAGVGEYIPDEMDEFGGAAEGDDILKVKIKIGKIKTMQTKNGAVVLSGKKDEGGVKQGDVHNQSDNLDHEKPKTVPRVVDPDDLENEQKRGARQGRGSKTVTVPNLSAQRAFPINTAAGLYKIVIRPVESYSNLYVSCSAIGEDGRTDILDMESFRHNSDSIPVREGKAGPIKVEANTPAIFFVRFVKKEKMVLNLQITEESRK